MSDAKLKILLIGRGGREHAFAWCLSKSSLVENVICVPGNGGTARGDTKIVNGPATLFENDYPGLVKFARSRGINLVVPCSEGPLVDGIEKHFRDEGIAVFGPTEEAARLEGSKCAAKDFMIRHGIPTAEYKSFRDFETARDYLDTITHPVVIKASGLAGGKGVFMPTNSEENLAALTTLMVDKTMGQAGKEVVIEERLLGNEISITFVTDGYTLRLFPAGQDAQRILDGNHGANTGGMGVYAPTPLLTSKQLLEIERTILQPTIDGIREEGHLFVGLMCIGLIMTSSGPKLLEYNVRFGDPEAQTLLPMLGKQSDLAKIMLACTRQQLRYVRMEFEPKSAVSVVLAADGYPEKYHTGDEIQFNEIPKERGFGTGESWLTPNRCGIDTLIFHAGTKLDGDTLRTDGGRVITSVYLADTLKEAVEGAYRGAECANFRGKYFRKDIGSE